jgi:hypothetical protein
MLAIIAAVLFGLALLLQLAGANLGTIITGETLVTAGLLCLALHLAGVATTVRGRGRMFRRGRL